MLSESPEEGSGSLAPEALGVNFGSKDACAKVTLLLLALEVRLQLKLG